MKTIVLFVCLAIGVAIAAREKRSFGGTDMNFEDALFFVSVIRKGSHVCGGAIISEKLVLTAASCVFNALNPIERLPYTTVISQMDTIRLRMEREITNVYPHEGFSIGLFWCNIAVIRVSLPFRWKERQMKIALPVADPPVNKNVTLVTWQTRKSEYSKAGLKKCSMTINSTDQPPGILRDLDPTLEGWIGLYESLYATDIGSPIVDEGQIVGIVATTDKHENSAFFVNVFACKTFIDKYMPKEAPSSSEFTDQYSPPAKRRRV